MSLSWEYSEGEIDYGFSDVEPEGNTSGDTPPKKPTQVADQESREATPSKKTTVRPRPRVLDPTRIAPHNQFSTGKHDLYVLQRGYWRSIRREEEEKKKKRKADENDEDDEDDEDGEDEREEKKKKKADK